MKKYIIIFLLLFPVIPIYSQNIDINLLRDINLNRNKHLDGAFKIITNTATPFAISAPLLLYGIGLIEKDSVSKQKALFIGATYLTSSAVTLIMKYSINRRRPFETYPDIEKLTSGGSPSFPSGHTSDAFSLATSISLAYPKWYVIIPSFAWAGTIGYSRLDLGVHYPSDVLAGAIVGAGSAYLCYKAQQWLYKKRKHCNKRN